MLSVGSGEHLIRNQRFFPSTPFVLSADLKTNTSIGLGYLVRRSDVLILNLHWKARHDTSLHLRNGLKIHTSVLPGSASMIRPFRSAGLQILDSVTSLD